MICPRSPFAVYQVREVAVPFHDFKPFLVPLPVISSVIYLHFGSDGVGLLPILSLLESDGEGDHPNLLTWVRGGASFPEPLACAPRHLGSLQHNALVCHLFILRLA